jgi:hypothetical protein
MIFQSIRQLSAVRNRRLPLDRHPLSRGWTKSSVGLPRSGKLRGVFVLLIAISTASGFASAQSDLCTYSETQFANFVGGTATGTAVTASLAGEKAAFIVMTNSGLLIGFAPVIAPAVTVSAASVTAAYASLKVWCSREAIKDTSATWYQTSVDTTSSGIEIAIDARGRAIGYTSRVFEGVAGVREKASGGLTDWMCRLSGRC